MIAVAHGADNWIYYITFVSGMAATWMTLYFRYIRPRAIEHQKHEAERKAAAQEEHDWIHGRAATLGSAAIEPAPVKLQQVRDSQADVVKAVKALTVRMDESNGTTKRIEANVSEIHTMIADIVLAGTDVKLNLGKDTKDLATLTDQSKTELLDAIHHSHGETT